MRKEYRINKFIAENTGCSRRKAEEYILEGLVKINGNVVIDLSTKVKKKDKVLFKGTPLHSKMHVYVIFNKPSGYITTRADENDRKTIYHLLPEKLHDLKPVGRLDKDTSGLLLLTNDGDLINTLTHPRYHIPKTYKAVINGKFNTEKARLFSNGIEIEEGQLARADILKYQKRDDGQGVLFLELHQGFNRQIRKMFEKVDCEVVSLKRLTVGPLNLKNLKRTEFSLLRKIEVDKLYEYVNKRIKESKEL